MATAFKIGDKVRRKYDGAELTVVWTSKGALGRSDQLIATEVNCHAHPYSEAAAFVAVAA